MVYCICVGYHPCLFAEIINKIVFNRAQYSYFELYPVCRQYNQNIGRSIYIDVLAIKLKKDYSAVSPFCVIEMFNSIELWKCDYKTLILKKVYSISPNDPLESFFTDSREKKYINIMNDNLKINE